MDRKLDKLKICHRLTIIICFLSVILPIIFWKRIPEQIPQHYGALGEADAWTGKGFLVVLFVFALMMLGMMSIAEYCVKNSGISTDAAKAKKGNVQYIYPMIVLMNLGLQIMIAYMIFCAATARNLGKAFLPVVLVLTFGPLIYFIPQSLKAQAVTKDRGAHLKMKEQEAEGEVYRSKIDWWMGLLLIGCIAFPLYGGVKTYLEEGTVSWILVLTELFMVALFVPMLNMRYILYPDHMLIICLGKERIPYRNITGMRETHNPLSSAALSLDRLQIDYKNAAGGHNMTLISPVRKKEFMEKVNKKRGLYVE